MPTKLKCYFNETWKSQVFMMNYHWCVVVGIAVWYLDCQQPWSEIGSNIRLFSLFMNHVLVWIQGNRIWRCLSYKNGLDAVAVYCTVCARGSLAILFILPQLASLPENYTIISNSFLGKNEINCTIFWISIPVDIIFLWHERHWVKLGVHLGINNQEGKLHFTSQSWCQK